MEKLTVIILVNNEKEQLKLSIKSFRTCAGEINDLTVIVVDNGSSDGLCDWAMAQTDFTYCLMDEGYSGYGIVLNKVRRELKIEGNLLIMKAHYMITPLYLARLVESLEDDDRKGAAGGILNGGSGGYGAAVEEALSLNNKETKYVMGFYPAAALFKGQVLSELGDFEEGLNGVDEVLEDYYFRMISADWKMVIRKEAILWELGEGPAACYGVDRLHDLEILENKWGMHYFNYNYNNNLLEFINESKEKSINILEVGCDCGATLLEIKNRFQNAYVYGTELNEKAAAIAAHVAQVMVNNIENENLPYKEKMFDYIIFGDVLEHLRDPQAVISYCRQFLKPGGYIIASIPNLMHISVIEQLLHGNFTYTEAGLLDKTHIHMFTYNEIIRMFQNAGYEIVNMSSVNMGISTSQKELIDRLLPLGESAQRFMYETFQYVVKVKA